MGREMSSDYSRERPRHVHRGTARGRVGIASDEGGALITQGSIRSSLTAVAQCRFWVNRVDYARLASGPLIQCIPTLRRGSSLPSENPDAPRPTGLSGNLAVLSQPVTPRVW